MVRWAGICLAHPRVSQFDGCRFTRDMVDRNLIFTLALVCPPLPPSLPPSLSAAWRAPKTWLQLSRYELWWMRRRGGGCTGWLKTMQQSWRSPVKPPGSRRSLQQGTFPGCTRSSSAHCRCPSFIQALRIHAVGILRKHACTHRSLCLDLTNMYAIRRCTGLAAQAMCEEAMHKLVDGSWASMSPLDVALCQNAFQTSDPSRSAAVLTEHTARHCHTELTPAAAVVQPDQRNLSGFSHRHRYPLGDPALQLVGFPPMRQLLDIQQVPTANVIHMHASGVDAIGREVTVAGSSR